MPEATPSRQPNSLPIVDVPVCLSADGSLLTDRTASHVDFLHSHGYRSFTFGGALEGGLIGPEELAALLATLRERHGRSINLTAFFASNCFNKSRAALRVLCRDGLADRVVHDCEFFSKLSFAHILNHWQSIRDAATVPLLSYRSARSVLNSAQLCAIVSKAKLDGVVDAEGSIATLVHLRFHAGPGVQYFFAHDEAYAEPFLRSGADQYISRLANVAPIFIAELQCQRGGGNASAVTAMSRRVEAWDVALQRVTHGAGLRHLLSRDRNYSDACRLPMLRLTEQEGARLAAEFDLPSEARSLAAAAVHGAPSASDAQPMASR
jgi:dihydrodipicolinate synthase/N-acetylneuraminate lyase